jgi:acid phosphatase
MTWLPQTVSGSLQFTFVVSLIIRVANFQFLAKKGITLENLFAVTHPSKPNYMAAVGDEYFGLDGDPFESVPSNVSSVVDLLEDKGISWSLYQEDMPYSGYQGFSWVNQKTGANDYVRKHKSNITHSRIQELTFI